MRRLATRRTSACWRGTSLPPGDPTLEENEAALVTAIVQTGLRMVFGEPAHEVPESFVTELIVSEESSHE